MTNLSDAREGPMAGLAGRKITRTIALAGLALWLGAGGVRAADADDGDWHFALTPYVWVPSFNGQLKFRTPGGGDAEVNLKPRDVLSKLDFAFMGTVEITKGRWGLLSDFDYLQLSNDSAEVKSVTGPGGLIEIPVDVGTESSLHGYLWTIAPTYTVFDGKSGSLTFFAGLRDTQLTSSLDWSFAGPLASLPQTGSLEKTVVLLDGIVGVKGRIALSQGGNWFVPYYFDIGTGTSPLTVQVSTGIGYAFSWGDLRFEYRALHYAASENRVFENVTLHGPTLAATFHL